MTMWLLIGGAAVATGAIIYGLLVASRFGWLGYVFGGFVAGLALERIARFVGAPSVIEVGVMDVGWVMIGAIAAVLFLRVRGNLV